MKVEFGNLVSAVDEFEHEYYNSLNTLGSIIKRISVEEKLRTEEENVTKESFNIFDCLTRHHLEELHSKILSYLLNPAASHNFGTLFLETFFEVLKQENDISNHLGDIGFKSDQIVLIREAAHELGRIDIYIEFPELIVIVENKIFASEQKDQIKRYGTYLSGRSKKYMILYLTIEGRDSDQAENTHYFPISYRKHITPWLRDCIVKCAGFPKASSGIASYLEMLEKRILNLTNSPTVMNIADLLMKPENLPLLNYLKEIGETNIEVRNRYRDLFFKKVHEAFNGRNLAFKPVAGILNSCTVSEIWGHRHRGFILTNEEFMLKVDTRERVVFCIEHDWDDLYFGVVGIRTTGVEKEIFEFSENTLYKEYFEALNFKSNYGLKYKHDCWCAWQNYFPFDKRLHFLSDKLNYDFATRMDEGVELFVSKVVTYLNHWRELINSKAV
jgi:hypothetical protein